MALKKPNLPWISRCCTSLRNRTQCGFPIETQVTGSLFPPHSSRIPPPPPPPAAAPDVFCPERGRAHIHPNAFRLSISYRQLQDFDAALCLYAQDIFFLPFHCRKGICLTHRMPFPHIRPSASILIENPQRASAVSDGSIRMMPSPHAEVSAGQHHCLSSGCGNPLIEAAQNKYSRCRTPCIFVKAHSITVTSYSIS